MQTVIIVIHLMLVLGLIGVVMLQKSEGGGLISSSSGFLTGRGTANVLTRTTAMLAVGFFLTSLVLSWLAGFDRKPSSIIQTNGPAPTQQQGPSAPAPLSTTKIAPRPPAANGPAAPGPSAPKPQ
jgi:preprotein translocase subunit SecG